MQFGSDRLRQVERQRVEQLARLAEEEMETAVVVKIAGGGD